jgi:hypothetical protein
MVTYLIKGLALKDFGVFTYSDAASATRAAESRFLDETTMIVSAEIDLEAWAGPALVRTYNNLIEEGATPVNKFATRADGARRVFALLEDKYKNQPVESEAANSKATSAAATDETKPKDGEDDMAVKGKTKKAKAPKKDKAERATVQKDSSRGKLLALAVNNPGITIKSLATRADVSGEGSMDAAGRVRLRLRKVLEKVDGATVTFEDGKVEVKLPRGVTLEKLFGEA